MGSLRYRQSRISTIRDDYVMQTVKTQILIALRKNHSQFISTVTNKKTSRSSREVFLTALAMSAQREC